MKFQVVTVDMVVIFDRSQMNIDVFMRFGGGEMGCKQDEGLLASGQRKAVSPQAEIIVSKKTMGILIFS